MKLAIFTLTSCIGCQAQLLDLGEGLFELLQRVEFSRMPFLGRVHAGPFDVALVEGCVSTSEEIEKIKKIRENAGKVVALGTCSCVGGIPAVRNFLPEKRTWERVYGGAKLRYTSIPAMPISKYISVDYFVPGCPFDKDGFLETIKIIARGMKPLVIDYNLCAECKLKENACLLDKKIFCMGPIIAAGCGALCPSHGWPCEGCRGASVDAEETLNTFIKMLEERGISRREISQKFKKYAGILEPFRRVVSENSH